MTWLSGVAVAFPLLAGMGLLLWRPKQDVFRTYYTMVAVVLSAGFSLAAMLTAYTTPTLDHCVLVRFSDLFSISLSIDGMGMVYGGLVTVLWPIVTAYALSYFQGTQDQNRFFAFWIGAFGVVLGIAFAEDFLSLYLFYELLTLCTLPLVMHQMDQHARYAGRKYVIYSLGGAAFAFIGMVFLYSYSPSLDFALGGVLDLAQVSGHELELQLAFVAAFFGFGVKAAIFPFSGWLPDASVAPTPVSALLHAVAVVKAGAFAAMRLIYFGFGPTFLLGTPAQTLAMGATIVTIVYGSARALRTPHFKRRLAFSTVSNLSYILFSLTIMTTAGLLGALTHMVFHGVIKITMFCCAGAVIHGAHKEYVYEFEGFSKKMPVVFAVFTIASFALIGVPPLGGFAGKWMIGQAAVGSENILAYVGIGALILSTLLTTLYLITIVARAYFPLGHLDANGHAHQSWGMNIPLILLTILGLVMALGCQPLITLLSQAINYN